MAIFHTSIFVIHYTASAAQLHIQIGGSLGVAVILYTDDTDFTDSHRKSP